MIQQLSHRKLETVMQALHERKCRKLTGLEKVVVLFQQESHKRTDLSLLKPITHSLPRVIRMVIRVCVCT